MKKLAATIVNINKFFIDKVSLIESRFLLVILKNKFLVYNFFPPFFHF